MVSSVITLTTDFGTKDTFVAEVKAVILSINPSVLIVDITHEIEPFNVLEAAIKLSSASKYFPLGSIHLAVVDPGVGSSRRPIIVHTERAFYVGPDNGILSLALKGQLIKGIYEIRTSEFKIGGPTFHARDVFAPASARLSRGEGLETLGRPINDFIRLSIAEPEVRPNRMIRGEVIIIDRFGNAITNIKKEQLELKGFRVIVKGRDIPLFNYYKEAEGLPAGALINSSGYLELFRYQGNVAETLNLRIHDAVEVFLE